jgi:hypothetical protein
MLQHPAQLVHHGGGMGVRVGVDAADDLELVLRLCHGCGAVWAALTAATAAWTGVALTGCYIARRLGAGTDGPPP